MSKALFLTLAIWSNSPDGMSRDVIRVAMPARVCMVLQAAIWRIPFATIGEDELGAIPSHDAACVPDDYPKFKGE